MNALTRPATEVHCLAARCRRSRRPQDVICERCHGTIAGMCRGKEPVDGYTARRRGEQTGRGWYRCLACNQFHQTRTRSGNGAYAARSRAERAIAALIAHRGSAALTELVASWAPKSGTTLQ